MVEEQGSTKETVWITVVLDSDYSGGVSVWIVVRLLKGGSSYSMDYRVLIFRILFIAIILDIIIEITKIIFN